MGRAEMAAVRRPPPGPHKLGGRPSPCSRPWDEARLARFGLGDAARSSEVGLGLVSCRSRLEAPAQIVDDFYTSSGVGA